MTSKTANLYALIFALVCPTAVTVAYFVLLADNTWGKASYAIGKMVQFAFPLFWVVVVLRERPRFTPVGCVTRTRADTPNLAGERTAAAERRVAASTLDAPCDLKAPALRGVPAGFVFGVLVAGGMLALYYAFLKPAGFFSGHDGPAENVRQKVVQLGLDSTWKFAAAAVFYSLCHSFMEEYYWRWFVFGRLRDIVAVAPAVLISSLGFMAHHVILLAVYFGAASPVTYLFSLAVAVGGAVWAWLYQRTGSLYGPWLSHLLVDAAIFVIGFDLISAVAA